MALFYVIMLVGGSIGAVIGLALYIYFMGI